MPGSKWSLEGFDVQLSEPFEIKDGLLSEEAAQEAAKEILEKLEQYSNEPMNEIFVVGPNNVKYRVFG